MTARFYADVPLLVGVSLNLPEQVARHVQVLRLQPGDSITLFNGRGDESPGGHDEQPDDHPSEGAFEATITRMGRSDVEVIVNAYTATQREARRAVHLAIGMPANERMDWLIEKATELGVASIQPLMSERSVLRIKGDRAEKKLAHWRGVAIAASEQCGRNRLPVIHDATGLTDWLRNSGQPPASGARLLLSLQQGTRPLVEAIGGTAPLTFLSGPEGGLSAVEEAAAVGAGFIPVTLGLRVLRAETAPLACLSLIALMPSI